MVACRFQTYRSKQIYHDLFYCPVKLYDKLRFFYRTVIRDLQSDYQSSAPNLSEREQNGKHKSHGQEYGYLERKAHTQIVSEGVPTGLHDKGVGRCGEGRGEAHARAKSNSEEEWQRTGTRADGDTHGDGRHEDRRSRVAHEECQQRGCEIDTTEQGHGAVRAECRDEPLACPV